MSGRMQVCRAIKNNGSPCRQRLELDAEGYCKYHQAAKFKNPTIVSTTTTTTDTEVAEVPQRQVCSCRCEIDELKRRVEVLERLLGEQRITAEARETVVPIPDGIHVEPDVFDSLDAMFANPMQVLRTNSTALKAPPRIQIKLK